MPVRTVDIGVLEPVVGNVAWVAGQPIPQRDRIAYGPTDLGLYHKAFTVLKMLDGNNDQVYQRPYPQTPQSEKHEDARSSLPHIESVYTQAPKQYA